MPRGLALVSAKISPTRAAPRVCPTSRAVARIPLALPASARGEDSAVVGGLKEAEPDAADYHAPGYLRHRRVCFLGGHRTSPRLKMAKPTPPRVPAG
jgi:hypothetical protein